MKISRSFLSMTSVVAMLLAGLVPSAQAQDYKDKTLTIIVGYSPGGSFDLYARVLARYIGRYLPGNPTRIVENMTGAGGIIAANHLYNRVSRMAYHRRLGVAVDLAADHGQ